MKNDRRPGGRGVDIRLGIPATGWTLSGGWYSPDGIVQGVATAGGYYVVLVPLSIEDGRLVVGEARLLDDVEVEALRRADA